MTVRDWILKTANFTCYAYRRNNWMFDLSRFLNDFSQVRVEKPVFLLGTQGGGLTLISRMLRRNPAVISVTGNHRYWAGADEMQNVLGPILPPALTGITHQAPPDELFDTPRGWLYATDQLIGKYRCDEKDAQESDARRFQRIIRWIVSRYSSGTAGVPRFVDKSQLYTVKVSYLNALLEGTDPRFVLITRNPYAICYRSVDRARSLQRLADRFTFQERLSLAAQHWANSMEYALSDRDKVKHFLILRFEDFLNDPQDQLLKLCEFIDLEYRETMLPQEDDQFPAGTLRKSRWYPLRADVNKKYLERIDKGSVEIIGNRCQTYAEQFGYVPPSV